MEKIHHRNHNSPPLIPKLILVSIIFHTENQIKFQHFSQKPVVQESTV
jgi:hypothetical protein